jgi:hypothetical protein
MNSTVLAATIGVSGTVIVGVAGFGAAIWNNRKTLAHARETRLWDQRVSVYVDALAAIHYRQLLRAYDTLAFDPPDQEAASRLEALMAEYNLPDGQQLQARLIAFATEAIVTAMDASLEAHNRAMSYRKVWADAMMRAGPLDAASKHAAGSVTDADSAALAAETAAAELIRLGLQGGASSPPGWSPFSPDVRDRPVPIRGGLLRRRHRGRVQRLCGRSAFEARAGSRPG